MNRLLIAAALALTAAKPSSTSFGSRMVPCPDNPQQACTLQNGVYLRQSTQPLPPPVVVPSSCVEDERDTVCGYHCIKDQGQMACAQTPQGQCASTSGKVACWDPPVDYVAYMRNQIPPARCVSNYGRIACGYHCVEHDGQVACSNTPMGSCTANFGKIACFDPPLGLLPLYQGAIPASSCMEGFDQLACGYSCVAQFGEVRCAKTPQGVCTTKSGKVVCWDPPVPTYVPGMTIPPQAMCLTEQVFTACGYNCLAHEGKVACARTPGGSCSVDDAGNVLCTDAPENP